MLTTLNISHNIIKRIENLSKLKMLKTLDIGHNVIQSIEDIAELKECPSLTSVDLSHNIIDFNDEIVLSSAICRTFCAFISRATLVSA